MANIVAIVGRPNVGKSTFFNRMIGERKSIVDDTSGVTRDRIYGHSEWNGKNFSIIDTGGFVKGSDDIFEKAIRDQVLIAMEEATHIIFMTDTTTGITDLDEEVARLLRKRKEIVFVAVNKVDNLERQLRANEFWSLGFENLFFVSSISGSGTGDLLDALVETMDNEEEEKNELPRIAIVGQPNVGKSSLTNALLGEERNIVTPLAGTTRDSIRTEYNKFDKHFFLIDTAGIRRKARVHENLEFYSVIRAVRAMEDSDVVILMIDANVGIESQDMSILTLALRRNKGIMIVVNKWDMIEKDHETAKEFEEKIKKKIAPFTDVPVLFTSVLEKQRIFKTIDIALDIAKRRGERIKTSELNELLLAAIERTPPPAHRSRYIKIKYVTQLPLAYPAFAFFCNHPAHVKTSYKHFLENQLRKNFDFTGLPIKIYFRDK